MKKNTPRYSRKDRAVNSKFFVKTMCLFIGMISFQVKAQQFPYTLTVFDEILFYDGYAETVNEPVPDGVIRHSNSCYAKKITEDQLASFGNTLTMNVVIKASCDNYDRIGNINLAFVPKGLATYNTNDVEKIELGRYITPFMNKNVEPTEVPYIFTLDNISQLFKDETITTQYDLWVELELFGVPYAANTQVAGCQGRNDVFFGTLTFFSDQDTDVENEGNYFLPLAFKYLLRNYTLEGTDVLGQTVKTIQFTLDEDVPNAKLYLITSNHGANSGGEEYVRRWHYIYFNDQLIHSYRPGGVSCVPFSYYNTQPNCIYINCATGQPRPDLDSAWSWNNWCPGDKIPIRVIELGNLSSGNHSFRINVPDAVFAGGQGEFPMSVYLQGYHQTLNTEKFETNDLKIYPNPVKNKLNIESNDSEVEEINVFSLTGQLVLKGSGNELDIAPLDKGVYIITVRLGNGEKMIEKIIKN